MWDQSTKLFQPFGYILPSLKLTAKTPENGWLVQMNVLLGRFSLFSGAFAAKLVVGRVVFLGVQIPPQLIFFGAFKVQRR